MPWPSVSIRPIRRECHHNLSIESSERTSQETEIIHTQSLAQPPGSGKTNVPFLKPSQIEAIRDAACESRHGERDDLIFTLLYDTSFRRRELSVVDRDMLDFKHELLHIPGRIQKDYPTDGTPGATPG